MYYICMYVFPYGDYFKMNIFGCYVGGGGGGFPGTWVTRLLSFGLRFQVCSRISDGRAIDNFIDNNYEWLGVTLVRY